MGDVTTPDGQVVTQNNVIRLTDLLSAFVKFPEDSPARKRYLQEIANAVVKMTAPVKSPGKLLDALGKAVAERRISVWSAFPTDKGSRTDWDYAIGGPA